jgi:hypothetical protein
MADDSTPPSFSTFALEIASAMIANAPRAADRVGQFLAYLGLRGNPKKPIGLPERFLIHLGSALQLLEWEMQGWYFHRDAGLPEARQAISDAFGSLTSTDTASINLEAAILRIFLKRFAWHAQRDLGADVALDDLTGDAALEALAEYLWATRHSGQAADGPQP